MYKSCFLGVVIIRLGDVKGIPVVCLESNSRSGYVGESLYDNQHRICGFLVELKGIYWGKRYVLLNDIMRLDHNALVIFNENSIRKMPRKSNYQVGQVSDSYLGRLVQTRNGEGLGTVKDLVFDCETGSIIGLELSRGFLEDLIDGRNVVMMKDGVEFGEDFIITEGGEFNDK